ALDAGLAGAHLVPVEIKGRDVELTLGEVLAALAETLCRLLRGFGPRVAEDDAAAAVVRVPRGAEVAVDRVHLVHAGLGDRELDPWQARGRRIHSLEIAERGDRVGELPVAVVRLRDPVLDLLGPRVERVVIEE